MNVACDLILRDIRAPFLPEQEGKITEISGTGEAIPLARVIPIINKQINTILVATQNTYVTVKPLSPCSTFSFFLHAFEHFFFFAFFFFFFFFVIVGYCTSRRLGGIWCGDLLIPKRLLNLFAPTFDW
jgi:hypothetical protein